MTLDEAIQDQERIIESCKEKINDVKFINKTRIGRDIVGIQSEYIQECEQYIEWLLDYKRLLELEKRFKRYTMQDDMHLVTIGQVKQVMEGEWL